MIEYLISNILNVILVFCETFYRAPLEEGNFYDIATDTVNILTILSRCVRLPVYCFCNRNIKDVVMEIWRNSCSCMRKSSPTVVGPVSDENENVETMHVLLDSSGASSIIPYADDISDFVTL